MILGLLGAHRISDMGSGLKPWRPDEVMISRNWARDLSWALNALGFYGAINLDIDHHRPQNDATAFDLKRRAVEQSGAAMAIETHCNYHPDEAVRGWAIEVKGNDPDSVRVGKAIQDAWCGVVPDEHIRLHWMPVPGLTYSWLFDHLEVPFVLPELPNLEVTKYRLALLDRGLLWRRLVEATALAIVAST